MTTRDSAATVSRRTVLKGVSGALATGVASEATIGSAAAAGEQVAMQYFCEDWMTIADDVDRVSDFGFDAIWIQAPQKSRLDYDHPIYEGRGDPPMGYQPIDLRVFDSVLGTEAELRTLIDTAHRNGLDVYVDTVMNHMAGGQDPKYEFPQFSDEHFHHDPDPDHNTWEMHGMPDLRQSSPHVRDELYEYMQKIADLGADGYRLDAVKHIPEWFWRDYAVPWAEEFDMFRVGEVWTEDVDFLQPYADTGMRLFDYPLYFTIEEAFSHGDLRELEGAGLVSTDPSQSMPFVDNHDVDAPAQYTLAHAFVLTIPGYPMLYNLYQDWLLTNDDIATMVWVKKHLARGSMHWLHTDSNLAIYERAGNLLVGLNNSETPTAQRVQTSWTNAELTDYANNAGNVTTDASGWVTLPIPAEGWVFYAPTGRGDANSGIVDGETYVVRNVNSGKVLDVAGVSERDGADVHQWEYVGGENQHWTVEAVGEGYYQLVASHSDKVLDVAGRSSDNGGNVQQWGDSDTETQQWVIEKAETGYRVASRYSGKVLDVRDVSTEDGATVHQWDWVGTDNQRWIFERVEDGGGSGDSYVASGVDVQPADTSEYRRRRRRTEGK